MKKRQKIKGKVTAQSALITSDTKSFYITQSCFVSFSTFDWTKVLHCVIGIAAQCCCDSRKPCDKLCLLDDNISMEPQMSFLFLIEVVQDHHKTDAAFPFQTFPETSRLLLFCNQENKNNQNTHSLIWTFWRLGSVFSSSLSDTFTSFKLKIKMKASNKKKKNIFWQLEQHIVSQPHTHVMFTGRTAALHHLLHWHLRWEGGG